MSVFLAAYLSHLVTAGVCQICGAWQRWGDVHVHSHSPIHTRTPSQTHTYCSAFVGDGFEGVHKRG